MEILPKDKTIIAVIIAIEKYRYEDIAGVKFAKEDALSFKNLLIEDFGADERNITLWINEQASMTALNDELRYKIRGLTKDDKFIFYYVGHGFHYSGINRLSVWDTHTTNLLGTSLSLKDILLDPLGKSPCSNSLVFIDSCATYIKETLDGRDLISSMSTEEFEAFTATSDYNAIFCSCSPGEKSYPDSTLRHGIWTWHLIEALKGNKPEAITKDVLITDVTLQNYLKKAVPDYITKETTHKFTQTPFARISSSGTFIIRKLPPRVEGIKAFPKLTLRFEDMEMRKTMTESVKKLSGFQKGNFVPDRVGFTQNSFIQSRAVKEIEDEIQEIYDNSKIILRLRRKDITKSASAGGGTITNSFFRYYLNVSQDNTDPGRAVFERRLVIRVSRSELPANFSNIFPIQPDEIVIPIDGKTDFDDLVEKFENLVDEIGGEIEEDDRDQTITYTNEDNLTITINTDDKEMIITPNVRMSCLELIDFTSFGLKKITGRDLLLLPG